MSKSAECALSIITRSQATGKTRIDADRQHVAVLTYAAMPCIQGKRADQAAAYRRAQDELLGAPQAAPPPRPFEGMNDQLVGLRKIPCHLVSDLTIRCRDTDQEAIASNSPDRCSRLSISRMYSASGLLIECHHTTLQCSAAVSTCMV